MVQLSEEAYRERLQQPDDGKVKVGYFSGSITHNADFEMILPVITELFKRCPQMELHVVGELDVPAELKPFESRIVKNKFVNWEKLPALIASVDINLAPVEQSILMKPNRRTSGWKPLWFEFRPLTRYLRVR